MIRQPPVRRRRDFMCIGCQFAGLLQSLLPRLPFGKTTGPPFAEILFADDDTAKVLSQDLRNLRQTVQPHEQWAALLATLQTAVKLIADFTRQPGDFSVTRHKTKIEQRMDADKRR